MNCGHVIFGADNQVERAVLSSTPESVTDLEQIKNHERARCFKVDDLSGPTIIRGSFDEAQVADYFSLIGSNLRPDATLQLRMFAEDFTGPDLLDMHPQIVGRVVPLGLFRVGLDKINTPTIERGNDPLTLWFDAPIVYKAFELIIEHGYVVDETAVYNDLPTQDEFGVVSLEAESAEITNLGAQRWVVSSNADASGGEALHKTGGGFHDTAGAGARFKFRFSATQNGAAKIWARVMAPAVGGNDSFHVSLNGIATTIQSIPTDGAWHWVEVASVSLSADTDNDLEVSAREDNLYIDKLVILPNADAAPTGTGPAASTFGVVGSTDCVQIRTIRIGSAWQAEKNYSYGAPFSGMGDPEFAQAIDGNYVLLRSPAQVKEMELPFKQMPQRDLFMLSSMEKERAGRPIFVSARGKSSGWVSDGRAFLGAIPNKLKFAESLGGFYETTAKIVEV